MRPYSDKLTELLQSLSANLDGEGGSQYSQVREVENVLIVPISSNRGLCGAFNTNIIKQSASLLQQEYGNCQVHFMTIGKKAHDILAKQYSILSDHSKVFDNLTFEEVEILAEDLMHKFAQGEYDRIVLDSPPVIAVADASILSREVTDTLLVVSAGNTEQEALRLAKQQLSDIGGHLAGTLLNKVDVTKGYGYYNYYYKYYRYYGNQNGSTKKQKRKQY
jgi:ATP synthase F1 gamma subunit